MSTPYAKTARYMHVDKNLTHRFGYCSHPFCSFVVKYPRKGSGPAFAVASKIKGRLHRHINEQHPDT